MDDFTTFSSHIKDSITPDIIKDAVKSDEPQASYTDAIRDIVQSHITEADKEFKDTGTEVAHAFSGAKVQDSMFDLMKGRHHDGSKQIPNNERIQNNTLQQPRSG